MADLAVPAVVFWSGGKDGCLALHETIRAGRRVEGLLTTVTERYDRISMHGVRRGLLEEQAAALGLPLREVRISKGATNEEYEAATKRALGEFRKRGVRDVVFGDLFLADIREYRERLLADVGLRGLFPLWGRDTSRLVERFARLGYRAVVVCADAAKLDASFAGREVDASFVRSLPPGVDSCGENGEFHTFVYDGPVFSRKVAFRAGEKVLRDGFHFADLIAE